MPERSKKRKRRTLQTSEEVKRGSLGRMDAAAKRGSQMDPWKDENGREERRLRVRP